MSYYASYDGNIDFNSEKLGECIKAIQEKYDFKGISLDSLIEKLDILTIYEYDETNDNMIFSGCDEKYCSDKLHDFFNLIAPYTEGGEIEFQGEDNTYWKICFEDGDWEEYMGTIVYPQHDFYEVSTEELKHELVRRGYTAFKENKEEEKVEEAVPTCT